MQPLAAPELLETWERGMMQEPAQRALTLMRTACPEESPDALAELPVGQRNALLLTLRERLFGHRFSSVAVCHACGERLEQQFDASDIRVAGPGDSAGPLALEVAGYAVRFRLPNTSDLTAIEGYGDAAEAERVLLERCLLSARHDGRDITAGALPAEVVAAIADAMERADPLAAIELVLQCPTCGHRQSVSLDLVDYIWRELDAWARRVLCEVHVLASAYGWSEREILNMRPWRRQIYLEMAGR